MKIYIFLLIIICVAVLHCDAYDKVLVNRNYERNKTEDASAKITFTALQLIAQKEVRRNVCNVSRRLYVTMEYLPTESLRRTAPLEMMVLFLSKFKTSRRQSDITNSPPLSLISPIDSTFEYQSKKEDIDEYCTYGQHITETKFLSLAMNDTVKERLKIRAQFNDFPGVISIAIDRKGKATELQNQITTKGLPKKEITNSNVRFHSMMLPTSDQSLHLRIWRNNTQFSLLVVLTYERLPQFLDFVQTSHVVPPGGDETYFLNFLAGSESSNLFGEHIVGLMPYTKEIADKFRREDKHFAFDDKNITTTLSYVLECAASRCYYFDTTIGRWTIEKCRENQKAECYCKHVYEQEGHFFESPEHYLTNSKKSYISSGYWKILVTVAIMWILYFIWTYCYIARARQKTNERSTIVINDHKPSESRPYVIEIFTGLREGSKTTSTVTVILHGRRHDSRVRTLWTKQKPILKKGGEDRFLIKAENTLGPIRAITMSYGDDNCRSRWYLHQVKIYDLYTRNYWVVFVNDWLDGDKGVVHKYYEVLSPEEYKSFCIGVQLRAMRAFRDKHLWFSLLYCPVKSNFTLNQRLATIFSTVLLTMMVNALLFNSFYSPVTSQIDTSTLLQICLVLSVGTAGIAFLYRCAVDILFRYCSCRYSDWLHDGITWKITPGISATVVSADCDQRVEMIFKRASEIMSYNRASVENGTSNVDIAPLVTYENDLVRNPNYNTQPQGLFSSNLAAWHQEIINTDGNTPQSLVNTSENHGTEGGIVVRDLKVSTTVSAAIEYLAWFAVLICSILCTVIITAYGISYENFEYILWYLSSFIAFVILGIVFDTLLALTSIFVGSCN